MKGFRKQFMECLENGTCKKIDCVVPAELIGERCARKLLLCTKYLEFCNSGLCREERKHLKENNER